MLVRFVCAVGDLRYFRVFFVLWCNFIAVVATIGWTKHWHNWLIQANRYETAGMIAEFCLSDIA